MALNSKSIYQKGFSLLEVLLAIFIISFALLSSVAVQIDAFKKNHSAYDKTIQVIKLANQHELQLG
ncbi:MAG: prepilin-type N-terminal cleavage/methylation domain-containing protein [Gammaproteobacteria bacterium]|nr:prepilin-type N-terminal cleavage/methylation domain-containing protein [Gammaproteobacteria bacterium]